MPTVTLQPVDGGANYYANHGFTNAVNMGWDNPGFIPIGPWLAPMQDQTDGARWVDLGWNTAYAFTGNSNMSVFTANHISAIVNSGELSQILSNNGGHLGATTVGLLTADEGELSDNAAAIQNTANSIQDHNFWWTNNTWNLIEFGDLSGTPAATFLSESFTTPNGTTRHIDLQSIDEYWFAGAHSNNPILSQGGLIYNLGRDMTQDEGARGSNYGDMIDVERSYQAGHFPAPIIAYIEDGGPYTEDTTAATYIKPAELNWAVWSSLIHGAQGIDYFNHSFAGPGASQDNMRETYYQTIQPGQTISMYDQVKATDAMVQQMAPILHSPNALNYVSTPGGYQFGTSGIDHTLGGIETAAHFYNGSYYIFADTRDGESQSNISANFTLNDPTATSVTVLNENRTIAVVNGHFTDNFATAATVHIYQVNEGGTPPPPPPAAPVITGFSPDTTPTGDGHTTATNLTLSGTGETGSTITIFDGTTNIGTVQETGTTWTFNTSTLGIGVHNFTATDTDANGTSNPSAVLAVTIDGINQPPPNGSFSTNFPTVENPVSAGGGLITSTSPGVNWSGLKLGGSGTLPVAPVDVSAGHLAESVDYANSNFGDALAVATGTWAADQTASVVVGNLAATPGGYEEFEIHLRTDPTTGAGYEIDYGYNNNYIAVATWHANGGYTNLSFANTTTAIHPGDTLTAKIQGNVITAYDNGVQIAQVTDNTFTTGNPGFGFNQGGTAEYGISSFSASNLSSSPPPPPPAAPVITGFSPDTAPTGDGHTTATTITLSGTGEDSSTITVFDGTTKIGTVQETGTTWSFNATNLAVGSHSFTATDTDTNGTSSASAALPVTIDAVTQPPPGSNLLTNGSFETHDYSGWTLGGNSGNGQFFIVSNPVEDGTSAAAFGSFTTNGSISQHVTDTAGKVYTLDFWLANSGAGTNAFNVQWDGQTLMSLTNAPTQGYKEYTFQVTGTGSDTLQFNAHNNPDAYYLDNVKLFDAGTTSGNLVTNGDFETNSFGGWKVGGANSGWQMFITNQAEHGQYAADIGNVGGQGTLTQSLHLTVGQHYELTFWLANTVKGSNESFSASIAGTKVYSETGNTVHGYVQHTVDFTATAATENLVFSGRNDHGDWHLDNISVVGIVS